MLEKKQIIRIKGTRDGLTLFIDDSCAFSEVLEELEKTIAKDYANKDDPIVSVTVQLGNRFLTDAQKDQIRELVSQKNRLSIHSFLSNVVLREEALQWKEQSDIKVMNRLVRSGQVLKVDSDLLLIGDVNPGGTVIATGNIYIMGNLRGIAHAGLYGDHEAVIVASYMEPSQLRIADYMSRAPDYESTGVYMECGFIDQDQDKIMIDRLQVLSRIRKDLSGFERRMQNG